MSVEEGEVARDCLELLALVLALGALGGHDDLVAELLHEVPADVVARMLRVEPLVADRTVGAWKK